MKTGCGPRDVSVMLTKLAEFLVLVDKTLARPKAQLWKRIWNFSSFTCFFCMKLLADGRGLFSDWGWMGLHLFDYSWCGWEHLPDFAARRLEMFSVCGLLVVPLINEQNGGMSF